MIPVLYLDVDGVLLQFPPHRTKEWWKANAVEGCVAAEGATEFFLWAIEHFEVRWLTAWCTRGQMDEAPAKRLAKCLGIPVKLLLDINNPLGWQGDKPQAINWEEHAAGRPWFWIDDERIDSEMKMLEEHDAMKHFIQVDTSHNPKDLIRTLTALKLWYVLKYEELDV